MYKNIKNKLIATIMISFFNINNLFSIENQERHQIIFTSTIRETIANTTNNHWTHEPNARIIHIPGHNLYQVEYQLQHNGNNMRAGGIFEAPNINGVITNLQCHYFTTNPRVFRIIRRNI